MFKCLDFWLLLRLIKYQQLVMLNNKLLGSQECGWYDMPEDLLFLQAIHSFSALAINPLDKTNRSGLRTMKNVYIITYYVFVRSLFWKSTFGNFPLSNWHSQDGHELHHQRRNWWNGERKDGCENETCEGYLEILTFELVLMYFAVWLEVYWERSM